MGRGGVDAAWLNRFGEMFVFGPALDQNLDLLISHSIQPSDPPVQRDAELPEILHVLRV